MVIEVLKGQMDFIFEVYRFEKDEFCNMINELEVEVYEWKVRV